VNTKICLSISTHHPEHWQPSWSLRTALTALAAFFPTKGDGAIGALDYTPQARACVVCVSCMGAEA
jgi:ubiquitin-conjugating enzyme E2 J1